MGMADSAIFCYDPIRTKPWHTQEMVGNYTCSADELPVDYTDWNEKWYSPVCRNWF